MPLFCMLQFLHDCDISSLLIISKISNVRSCYGKFHSTKSSLHFPIFIISRIEHLEAVKKISCDAQRSDRKDNYPYISLHVAPNTLFVTIVSMESSCFEYRKEISCTQFT